MNVKISKAVVVALMSLSGAAMANPPQANANASATGVGISSNHNSVTGYTSGYAIGNANSAYGVGGNATAVSGQGGTGFGTALSAPTQTVNVGGTPAQQTIEHKGHSRVDTNAPAYAPNIYPTAACMGSTSVGGNFGQWLFGFSGGTSWEATECQIQEASRNAPTQPDRVFVWCKSKHAAGAPSCQGIVMPTEKSAAVIAPIDSRRAEVATVNESGKAPGFVW